MNSDEVLAWRIYLREPRGDHRADFHNAAILQAIYASMASFGGQKPKISIDDCMLKFEPNTPKPQDSLENLQTISKIFPGVLPKGTLANALKKTHEGDK